MKRLYILWIILLMGIGKVSNAQITLPRLISNGMVLQRNTEIPVWGWASPGENIQIIFNGVTYKTKTDPNKKWTLKLAPMDAGGPYTMRIDGKNHVVVKNILIGDVWVCSGQSNMEFWMGRVKTKYANEIANSSNDLIREFDVKPVYDFDLPRKDVESAGWKPANPENVLHFTAVGYFFARSLFEKYQVPIGLINSSKGGTPIESWISEEALKPFPKYAQEALMLKDSLLVKDTIEKDQKRSNAWFTKVNSEDRGLVNKNCPWYSQHINLNDWSKIEVPGSWNEQISSPPDGVVWYRKVIRIQKSDVGKKAVLYLGNIVDNDITYVNGVKIGETKSRYFPRVYQIPQNILIAGDNNITVRIVNLYGNGGFIKDKPYNVTIGEHEISLEGSWKYKIGIAVKPYHRGTVFFYKPLGLYNGMIAPITHYAIKGIIWYQGEANTKQPTEYRQLFPALIHDWRNRWHEENLPFLFVQLTSYLPAEKKPSDSQWAELREAQLMTLSVPNTGMAVTIDIGAWNDVHPTDKKDVGERLALAARKVAYHENHLIYSGPIYRSMSVDGNKILVSFDHIGGGLVTSDGGPLKYFTIAGRDGKFVWANARIQGNRVMVWNDSVSQPVAVRYGWADNPDGANLFNKEGLPASPFRTDKQDTTIADQY